MGIKKELMPGEGQMERYGITHAAWANFAAYYQEKGAESLDVLLAIWAKHVAYGISPAAFGICLLYTSPSPRDS